MKRVLAALISGFIFAVGLAIGGMTDPQKVIGFLDVTGAWDPSLAFVMGGAIVVYAPLFRLAMRRSTPLFDGTFHLPTRKDIDARLLIGSSLFGIGWGLGGFCPGPALTSVMSFGSGPLVFTAAMLTGMGAFSLWERRKRRTP